MNRMPHWSCVLTLVAAVGAGWGASADKKTKTQAGTATKAEKAVVDKKAVAPPAWEDSLKRARFAEKRFKRVEEHRKALREQRLAHLTPEQRVKAEESERWRMEHRRAQDSLNTVYMAQMRERARQRAEAEKPKSAEKPAPAQGKKSSAKKK